MKLLTHNVYWFQGHPSRWGVERVAEAPEVLAALTRLYAANRADVLCLQEVHRSDLAESLAQALGLDNWLHAPGGLRPDYGGAVASRHRAPLRDLTRPDGGPPHERVHLRASVERPGGPLEVAAVHLPSNRFATSREAGDVARVAELQRVLAGPDRPHMVVGDLNCQPDSPPYHFLQEEGYADAELLSRGDGARPRRVDYVWLDPSCVEDLADFTVLDSGPFCRAAVDGSTWRLSDHPPLLVDLR